MTLLEVRTALVKQTGRYDLVSSPTTFTDNGANYFINQAQRYLDRKVSTPFTKGTYRHKILSGESVFVVPGFRVIERAFLMKDGTKIELRKRDKEFLRWLYDTGTTPVSTTNESLYFAEAPLRTSTDQQKWGTTVVVNGTFATDLSGWTVGGSGLTQNNGQCHHAAGASGTLAQTVLTSGRTYLLQARVYRRGSAGDITFTFGTSVSFIYSQTGTIYQEITADGTGLTITFSSNFSGWVDDIVVREVHNEFQADFDASADLGFIPANDFSSQIGIVIYPAVDPATGYSLSVEGEVYSKALSADTDVSWWSTEHPQTLIDATKFLLERTRRNQSGINMWRDVLAEDIQAIDYDTIAGQVANFSHKDIWNE